MCELDRECRQLEDQYRELLLVQGIRHFRRALVLAGGIRKRWVDYEDLETRIPVLELEADYADGEACAAQRR